MHAVRFALRAREVGLSIFFVLGEHQLVVGRVVDCVKLVLTHRYHDIDKLEGHIRVAESDGGDVNVRDLTDGLRIDMRVSHDEQTRLLNEQGM